MKNSLMAQTTRLASFGPIFVVPAQSIMYLVIRTYIYNRTFVSIKKKRRKMKKKTHLWPKRHQTRRLGPFSLSLPNPSCI